MFPISMYFKTMFTGFLGDKITNKGSESYRFHLRNFWGSLKKEGTKIRMLEEIFALDITVLENSKDILAQRPTHYLKSSH